MSFLFCVLCILSILGNMNKLTTDKFIEKAKKVHGDKYDYSLTNYEHSKLPVIIKCSKHDKTFKTTPTVFLSGCVGCHKCITDKRSNNRKKHNTQSIIEKFKNIHGDKYDYSLVSYENWKIPVKIKCLQHNRIFEIKPYYFISGQLGCYLCTIEKKRTSLLKYDPVTIINKFKSIHGNKYDYSLVKYIDTKKKIKIICPKHGIFEQTPVSHITGRGCKKCGYELNAQNQAMPNKGKSLGELYPNILNIWDWNSNNKSPFEVSYGSKSRVHLICKEGHKHTKSANYITSVNSCVQCNQIKQKSTPELILLYELKYFYKEISATPEIINGQSVDILIKSKKIIIEYDGIYFHKNRFNRDIRKNLILEKCGYKVIRIRNKKLQHIKNSILINEDISVKFDDISVLSIKNIIYKILMKIKYDNIKKLNKYMLSNKLHGLRNYNSNIFVENKKETIDRLLEQINKLYNIDNLTQEQICEKLNIKKWIFYKYKIKKIDKTPPNKKTINIEYFIKLYNQNIPLQKIAIKLKTCINVLNRLIKENKIKKRKRIRRSIFK